MIKAICPECGGADTSNWCEACMGPEPVDDSVVAYRICDVKRGVPFTLFHGIRGSRRIPLDRWVEADVKTVHDGDKGRPYKSGFHVLMDKGKAKQVLAETFKRMRGRAIVRVMVRDTWPKSHSRHGVVLARYMRVRSEDWDKRVVVRA